MFRWAELLGCSDLVQALRLSAAPLKDQLPGWVLFSFPDAAWVYSATAAYLSIWRGARSAEAVFWVLLAGSLGIGGELGQMAGLVPGTFDPVDLASMLFALVFVVFVSGRIR